ncbi:MAG: cytidine deaminase [Roseivirga sp.]|jgi:cytidine deaminase
MNKTGDITISCQLQESQVNQLSEQFQTLVNRADEARAGSHSPYSGFQVGAALLLESGEIVIGSNQENAAYPSGLCAERTALFWAGANYPHTKILAIAVTVPDRAEHIPFPCGSCLQVISEYQHKQDQTIEILLKHPQSQQVYLAKGVQNLLPFAFEKSHLPKD